MTDFRRYLHAHRVQVTLRLITEFKSQASRYSVIGLLCCLRESAEHMVTNYAATPIRGDLANAIRDAHFEEMTVEKAYVVANDVRRCLRYDYGDDRDFVWDDEPWYVLEPSSLF